MWYESVTMIKDFWQHSISKYMRSEVFTISLSIVTLFSSAHSVTSNYVQFGVRATELCASLPNTALIQCVYISAGIKRVCLNTYARQISEIPLRRTLNIFYPTMAPDRHLVWNVCFEDYLADSSLHCEWSAHRAQVSLALACSLLHSRSTE